MCKTITNTVHNGQDKCDCGEVAKFCQVTEDSRGTLTGKIISYLCEDHATRGLFGSFNQVCSNNGCVRFSKHQVSSRDIVQGQITPFNCGGDCKSKEITYEKIVECDDIFECEYFE